jgi:hypothetical protein
MRALMFGGAEETSLRRDAFAARQVHAALGALDHIFTAGCGRLPLAAVNAAAVALQDPVNKQQPEDEENDLGQSSLRCRLAPRENGRGERI